MSNTRNYQAVFILNTRNQNESASEVTSDLKTILKSLGAEVTGENSLGRLDFVRVTDRKETNGHYVVLDFTGSPSSPAALQEKLRLDKRVKRVIVFSADAAVAV
jgi:small subunit ribosomal protein S6